MTNLETTTIIIQDGYKVDAETGEILGLAEPFQVTDVKSAEWVMQKMHEAESQAKAYEAQAADILANLCKLTKFHRSKAEWLKTCYGSQLEEVAKANEDRAIAWALLHEPDSVKRTLTLLKGHLPVESYDTEATGLALVPEGESVTIKVGA